MVQPAYQIDQLQVEPGSGQTLTISRDAPTGSLNFVDAVVTGGINLSDLAGLASIGSVFVVGSAGAGATLYHCPGSFGCSSSNIFSRAA